MRARSFPASCRTGIYPISTTIGTGVRDRADLQDVRIHDIRHSFTSRALALGESLSMIGKLLGHNKIDTTSRYAHLARDSIKASSAPVADSIGADILDRTKEDAAVSV